MNTPEKSTKSVLGRGLHSLLKISEGQGGQTCLPLDRISPCPVQPRKFFNEVELAELAKSIQEKGVLQPIFVRPNHNGNYEIVAGERRWRASKMANLLEIPVVIRDLTDTEALEIALIENIQRTDLNPIEEGEGYDRLMRLHDHTQVSLSQLMGKSRSHIANTLRLLTLPDPIQLAIKEGRLSAGHARALVGVDNPEELLEKIMNESLSVREVENLSKNLLKDQDAKAKTDPEPDLDKEVIQAMLTEFLGTGADLMFRGKGGKIIISFKTPGELDVLLEKFRSLEPKPPFLFGFNP